jgi:hypothetical protein
MRGVTVLQIVVVLVTVEAGSVVVDPFVMPMHEHADRYADALPQQA